MFFRRKKVKWNLWMNDLKSQLHAIGVPDSQIIILAKQMFNSGIKEAKQLDYKPEQNIANEKIANSDYMNPRIEAGLSQDDIFTFWNRPILSVIVEQKLSEAVRLALFQSLINSGKSDKEAAREIRKTLVAYGDPKKDHENFTGVDGYLYPEFASRVEKWRTQLTLEDEVERVKKYSTYNAMIRVLITEGKI